tara:strand:- start:393 stop:854 length:462 start_codon:yes stop_codon:yes gene_type:complete
MGIVSFNFDKISAEKIGKITEKVNINHNFNIKHIEKTDVNLQGNKAALKLSFDFAVNYEPNIGNIQMNGNIVYLEKEEEINKLNDQWKKEKKLPMGITSLVANTILTKGNIKALMLSQEVNLPPQIHLPKVTPKDEEVETKESDTEKKEDYIG